MKTLCTLALLGLVAFGAATSCSQQYECQQVSDNYNYVECDAGQCACRTDLGFDGAATTEDPCRCDHQVYWGLGNPYCKECVAPRSIIYANGLPYCVDLAECEAQNEQNVRAEKQKAVVRKVYEELIYPNPLPILENLRVEGIFTEDVKGRVTPLGSFEGMEGTVEYFYALATGGSLVTDVFFIDLISEGNEVAVRVDIQFNYLADPSKGNLTETGVFTFNDDGLIYTYDLAILRLGKARDLPAATYDLQRQFLCQSIMTHCPPGSEFEEYADFQTCVDFLESLPFGTWDQAEANSVTCRLLHNFLIPVRPDNHCPHVGPTGGGKCVDFAYSEFYQSDF